MHGIVTQEAETLEIAASTVSSSADSVEELIEESGRLSQSTKVFHDLPLIAYGKLCTSGSKEARSTGR